MKVWNAIVKIVIALAAIAGIIYVAATYGDRITAWAKKLLNSCTCCCGCGCDCDCDCDCGCTCDAEEAPAEAVAEQADFEG